MSDVDLIRRAAAKVRETAEAASAGRWSPEQFDGVTSDGPDKYVVFADYGSACSDEDGRHIALFDPTVALAVADWPDLEAAVYPVLTVPPRTALAVARAILREPAP